MDSLTQAVLGAGIQGALLGRQQGRKAYLYGAILATLPDLDVLVRYADPVSSMTYHRGFSHSLLTLTLFSMVLARLLRRWRPSPQYSGWRLWLAIWLALITHPLLDAFTSYGTQLWWPWTPVPASWSSIFIIDPIFTLPLLVATLCGLLFGARSWTSRLSAWALVLSGAYLVFTLAAKMIVDSRVEAALRQEGIASTAMFSSPTPLNSLLWRVVVKTPDDQYIELLTGLFDGKVSERGNAALGAEAGQAILAGSFWHDRLAWFSGGWLRYDRIGDELIVTDLRMGTPGNYSFRFKMAEYDPVEAQWNIVVPQRWSGLNLDAGRVRHLLTRIWTPSQEMPVQDWLDGMEPSGVLQQ